MRKKLPIGISDFKELMEHNCYLVDKSMFIKETLEQSAKVILLPRPRRFGKTLNISMLHRFFEITEDKEETRKLFKGLAIEKEPLFKEHFAKYPVIFLTFKGAGGTSFEEAFNSIKDAIAAEFERHCYLIESDALTDFNKREIQDIIERKANKSVYKRSLKDLSNYLYAHYNNKPVILIDEYDAPIHAAFSNNSYKDCVTFFRGFFGEGLKDNPNIYKGVITGILRIAKESIFSEMNNLGVYSVLRSEYSETFGFTENEVKELLSYYNIKNQMENVRGWYNGYIFGRSVIYNPWSILEFASSEDHELTPYWVNTGSTTIIKNLVKNSPEIFKKDLQELLNDKPVIKKLNENIVFDNLDRNETALYSFLILSGYLKAFDKKMIADEYHYKIMIPNKEIRLLFKNVISQWISESYENPKLNDMLDALLNGDIEVFEKILDGFVINTLSYFDTEKKNVEKVYQAFILGMLVNLEPEYKVRSEKESGYGRYDISIIPKDKSKKAVIMELKKLNRDESKDKALESALKQIEEKKYETDIISMDIKDIIKIGVVFDGKRVWVKTG